MVKKHFKGDRKAPGHIHMRGFKRSLTMQIARCCDVVLAMVFGVLTEFEFDSKELSLSTTILIPSAHSFQSLFSTDRLTQRIRSFFFFQRVFIPELCRSTSKMNKRGMTHVRVGHAGAPHPLQKRSCKFPNQSHLCFHLISLQRAQQVVSISALLRAKPFPAVIHSTSPGTHLACPIHRLSISTSLHRD